MGSIVATGLLLTACTGSGGDGSEGAGAASTTSVVPLPSTLPAPDGAACEAPSEGGSMFVTVDCVDPELREPYIDIDEARETTGPDTDVTVSYRYVHGGFTGTDARFSLYFPVADAYAGRFFQSTYPTTSEEDATPDTIAFAISHGAYVVSTNNGGGVASAPVTGGYRVNAAAAKFSRLLAAELYGDDAPVRGYLYGASGGAYQTIGGLENTSGVWDGGVPMVPGTPNSIPSFQGVQLLGLRVLGDELPGIVDALEPGGSGDPYAGLDDEQRAILDEVTAMGFPPKGWWQHASLDGGSFYGVAAGVRTLDPTYVHDFWNAPGYEGADPGSSVRAARVQFDTTVADVGGGSQATVTLSDVPSGDLVGADLVITSGDAAGQSAAIGSVSGSEVTFRPEADPATIGSIRPGDQVRIDNSWFLALQYYHRYQVPTPDMYGWNQFRDAAGAPVHPQRPSLVGEVLAGVSGGVATGRFHGKMIVLASTLDVEAFPWSADWYQQQARAAAGDQLDDSFRLWFTDNADHTPPKNTQARAHIVDYQGELHQALLDLDVWVADGVSPPASSSYRVTDDNQIVLPASAEQRGGVQPAVTLAVVATDSCDDVADDNRADVAAGQPVTFSAAASLPPNTGDIVRVEWDFEGTGTFPDTSRLDDTSPDAQICETHTYPDPGTYFAVVRVTAHREGDTDATYGLVQNLARVRVVVD